MRNVALFGAAFVCSLLFLTLGASSEAYEFETLLVPQDQDLEFKNDTIWMEGDILIDGTLSIENCQINVNRSLDFTISEIRVNSTGFLVIKNTTITTQSIEWDNSTSNISSEQYSHSMYTVVSDGGSVVITNTSIKYAMIWLVGGDATLDNTTLDGFNQPNYGIFSEDTDLSLDNVYLTNYSLGLRSIGSHPVQESVFFSNCTTRMTQEWWVTFSAVDESTSLPISGFEIRQWDSDGSMLGSWNWAKEYEIDSEGQKLIHTSSFTSHLNLYFAYVEDEWKQRISGNTDIIRKYNINHTSVSYESAVIFVDGIQLKEASDIISKWSVINLSVVVNNPTDLNFNNLYLDLEVNNGQAFARTSFKLLNNTILRENVTWTASIEGPLSLRVSTKLVDVSLGDAFDISLSKFIEIESSVVEDIESSNWGAFFAIFLLFLLCSYIIYNDVEAAETDMLSDSREVTDDSDDENGEDGESSGENEEE